MGARRKEIPGLGGPACESLTLVKLDMLILLAYRAAEFVSELLHSGNTP